MSSAVSCPNCTAPMASDQRYCLECGTRGAEARLPFLEILRADTAPAPPGRPAPVAVGVAVPPPGFQDRLRVNSGLVAGVGVLLLAMLVGVLIGSAGGEPAPVAASTPAPQVITVGGGAPAPAAAAPTGATGDAGAADEDDDAGGADRRTRSGGKAAKAPKGPARATSSAVKELDKLTGAARQKAVEKLGKAIPTGGAPPKRDSKPPAGGGDFEEIG